MANEDTAPDLPTGLRIDEPEEELEAGAQWLRTYLEGVDQDRLVVCVSGGLDSATTALWAARAVGPDRLVLLSLPYGVERPGAERPGDPEDSVELASAVAERIGGAGDFRVLDVAPAVDREAADSGLLAAIDGAGEEREARLWYGNLKARVRGVRARTVANVESALVLGTENRSEYLLGYFTVDGDEQSDLGLLRAYYKTEARQLAEALDAPQEIRDRPPSAGLWRGQEDAEELGFSYRQADRVLHHLFDRDRAGGGRTSPEQELTITGLPGVEPEVARRVLRQVEETTHKRSPTPRFGRVGSGGGSASGGRAPPRDESGGSSLEAPLSEAQRRRLEGLGERRGRDEGDDDRKHRR